MKQSNVKKIMKRYLGLVSICLVLSIVIPGKYVLQAEALLKVNEMSVFQGVTVSPDKTAWTTDYLDKTNERLEKGYTINTGITSTLRALRTGEHYYNVTVTGDISVGKWEVVWPNAQCIHEIPYYDRFCGFDIKSDTVCLSYYNNGWNAYCADCGELISETLFYGKSSTIGNITAMPADAMYVYICPYCEGLEQGRGYSHICKAISCNYYEIVYEANPPGKKTGEVCLVEGFMASTKHMYDNASTYNGVSSREMGYGDTSLRENTYTCEGYEFIGWNTESDGSGKYYANKEKILNLTDEEGGVVRLFAQWKKSQSSLVLDANGGKYQGEALFERMQDYKTTYYVNDSFLTPKEGYDVSFETNGGSAVGKIKTTKSFSHWEAQEGFQGSFEGGLYIFEGTSGSRNILKAIYTNDGLVLPDSVKAGVSLEGWYTNPGLGNADFVGRPGDYVVIEENTTLYAKWITLTLWAYDDYESHDGKGAVDLTWEQKDGTSKFYRIFQSRDRVKWNEVFSSDTIVSEVTVSEQFHANNVGNTYLVSRTGYYTISANGASGADYDVQKKGGAGGLVSAEYWLQKGDIITFLVGSAGTDMHGGVSSSGANGGNSVSQSGRGGGAATEVFINRNGEETLLLIAGGGGGANAKYSGGNGGTSLTVPGNRQGKESDYGGGGGGAQGGNAGGSFKVTTLSNTTDFAFKSKMIQNLAPGTVEVYGMQSEIEPPSLKKITGSGQNTWKWITEMGALHSSFNSWYNLWYDKEENMFFGSSTGKAGVGTVPYIKAQARDGVNMYLAGTYDTNQNTNLRIGGGLYRKDYGAPGHTRLLLKVTNAETGEILYNNYMYKGYSDNTTAGIAAVVDVDVSSARRVTINFISETEGTQENTNGHETQLYFSDILFYGKTISDAIATTGGSSYINTGFGCRNQKNVSGINVGDGYAKIESKDIGYREETELPDVSAKDLAPPDMIEEYVVKVADTNKIMVSFEAPNDNGTKYYHMVKSYGTETGNVKLLAESNETENILTTGVKGYYYRLDLQKTGTVDESGDWIADNGRQQELLLNITESDMYLHIAAVDKAGNIGPTQNIRLKMDLTLPTDPSYAQKSNLYTKKLALEDSQFVYQELENVYYVKADGAEHKLLAEVYMDTAATKEFQIDEISLLVGESEKDSMERMKISVPHGNIAENHMTYMNESIAVEMSERYLNYMEPKAVRAERKSYGSVVLAEEWFSIGSARKAFIMYPKAYADLQGIIFSSKEVLDKENAIWIIPDGVAPSITGLEELKKLDVLDMTDQNVWFELWAEDYESGLGEFSLCIKNRDNYLMQEYLCDENGKIKIMIDKDNPLFMGNIMISAMAVDRVGNANIIGENGLTFALETDLYKERNPEEDIFKTGDGAILDITTIGYVEKLEVIFPDELLQCCPDIPLVYEYEYPYLKHKETIIFSIPLGISEQEYELIIKAYKNGEMLVSKQTLVIVRGNILDELRTRIRNNS